MVAALLITDTNGNQLKIPTKGDLLNQLCMSIKWNATRLLKRYCR